MFDTNNIFITLFTVPILNVLIALYKALIFVGVPGALGFALIILTGLIRLCLYPLTAIQLKSSHKLSKVKPELDRLAVQYKDDKLRLQQEQLKLYKEAGINPAAGCLPLLLQLPILIAIYNLFFQLLNTQDIAKTVDEINKVLYFPLLKISSLNLSFFGLNLAQKPSEWQKIGWWLLFVPVITALLQYWQTKAMTSVAPDNKTTPQPKSSEDFSQTMQKQMAIMMPLMIGFFSYSFPIGLALYWNTFTVFGIIQQHQISKKMKK